MNEGLLKKIQSAVVSLTTSTNVVLEADGVRARVSGRASPYVSRHEVEFEAAPAAHVWRARNARYDVQVLVGDSAAELDNAPSPTAGNFLGEWATTTVPRGLMGALLAEFPRWGLEEFPEPDAPLVRIMIWVPAVEFFHSRTGVQLIPVMRDDVLRLDGPDAAEPMARQGHLAIYAVNAVADWAATGGPVLLYANSAVRLLNHEIRGAAAAGVETWSVWPMAAVYSRFGRYFVWRLHVGEPVTVSSTDHPNEEIVLPFGDYIAAHLVPQRNGND